MIIDIKFSRLEGLVHLMGAKRSSWKAGSVHLDPIERIRRELLVGKEILIDKVESKFGGMLTHEGQQVILYIKDTRRDRSLVESSVDNAPRFHIAECQTLERMREQKRFERYVVTNGATGIFKIEVRNDHTGKNEEVLKPLYVCMNCLSAIDWKRYRDQSHSKKVLIRNEFSLDDFFAEFATFFQSLPRYTDRTAPPGGYASDWGRRSERFRVERDWKCDECGVVLKDHRALLHCHHKNGVVSDNAPVNIAVLCVLCHSQQPAHGHLKPKFKERQLIESLRRSQRVG